MSRTPKIHLPLFASFDEALTEIADENKPSQLLFSAKPFVKWVGGKRSILAELTKRLPPNYTTYNELFLGGGALFFAIQPAKAYLSDINFHLIITFQVVRDDIEKLIKALKIHAENHNKKYFLNARENLFTEKDRVKIAALFIYLNKTCYNGLYRVNKAGKFNVPMGDYKDPPILDEENLKACSKVLANAEIKQHDFSQIKPIRNDFYYIDPPYHETYSGYDGNGFGDEQHKTLAAFCQDIDKAGGFFMLSNSNTNFVKSLYKAFNIEEVSASRMVSCKGNQRGKETEFIIRNYK